MTDDLKNFRAPDSFQLLEESEAAHIFWILLIVAAIVL